MKKEAINSFSEGLNYDLNPITTPNNVLTECINGTFITFNGDELALQNDAGNTKIKAPDWTKETPKYVSLTDGFYPIGIKEYGGVLYIVSGKTPVSTEWGTSGNYPIGAFVHDSNGAYYKSLINSNNDTLPTYTNTSWEKMESWNTFANTYGQIEFGSYPSPIFEDNLHTKGLAYTTLKTVGSSQVMNLYSSTVINNTDFKSGRYVTFGIDAEALLNSQLLSYIESNGHYVKKLYKLRLLHQLSNGMFDLTSDVWTKYLEFKNLSPTTQYSNYWVLEPDFKYFCPSQYKGKLALSVEIEDLNYFSLNDVTKLEYIPNDNKLYIEDSTSFPANGIVAIAKDLYPYSSIDTGNLVIANQAWASHSIGEAVSVIISSELNGDIITGDYTELLLDDVTNFPSSGTVNIGDETFTYTSKDTGTNKLISSTPISLQAHTDNTIIWLIDVAAAHSTLTKVIGPKYRYTVSVKSDPADDLVVPSSRITWYYNDVEIGSIDSISVNGVYEGSIDLLASLYKDKVVSYRATPNLQVGVVTYVYEDLPIEFTSKYAIYGEKLVSLSISDVVFELVTNEITCDPNHIGMASYNVVVLKNSLGQYIDGELNLSVTPYALILSGYTTTGSYTLLKEYTINTTTGNPSIIADSTVLPVNSELIELFEDLFLYRYSESCDRVNLTLSSNLNYLTSLITVVQNGNVIHGDVDSVFSVQRNIPIFISASDIVGFFDISEVVKVRWDTDIKLAFISKLDLAINIVGHSDPLVYGYKFFWEITPVPAIESISILTTLTTQEITLVPVSMKYSGNYYSNDVRQDQITIDVTSGTLLQTEGYYNIKTPISNFKVFGAGDNSEYIFNATTTFNHHLYVNEMEL